jgi:hypothetical protein
LILTHKIRHGRDFGELRKAEQVASFAFARTTNVDKSKLPSKLLMQREPQ